MFEQVFDAFMREIVKNLTKDARKLASIAF